MPEFLRMHQAQLLLGTRLARVRMIRTAEEALRLQ
jgi:hypothetical protein